jgi:hypothetical protein
LGPKSATASRHAAQYSASGTVALPGIHRRRTASSSDSTWMPMAVAPAARSAASAVRSPGGSHCTWIGRPGTAARTAATQRARYRAPRSGAAEVPVVITIWRTPSSRTAASATAARSSGALTRVVAPAASDASMAQKRHRVSGA